MPKSANSSAISLRCYYEGTVVQAPRVTQDGAKLASSWLKTPRIAPTHAKMLPQDAPIPDEIAPRCFPDAPGRSKGALKTPQEVLLAFFGHVGSILVLSHSREP